MTPTLALALVLVGFGTASQKGELIPLSSLSKQCQLRDVSILEFEVAMLDCGSGPRRVDHLSELRGLVKIETPEAALEFARVFSIDGRWVLAVEPTVAEVTVAEKGNKWGFVLQRAPPKWFREPTVTESQSEGTKVFRVGRTIVDSNYAVCWMVEEIHPDGARTLVSKKVVSKDVRRLGSLRVRGRYPEVK